jgi:CubicO group peptidase (beta-lactamase class C family)
MNGDEPARDWLEVRCAAGERSAADEQTSAGLLRGVAGADHPEICDSQHAKGGESGDEQRADADEEPFAAQEPHRYHSTMVPGVRAAVMVTASLMLLAPGVVAESTSAAPALHALPAQAADVPWPTVVWPTAPVAAGVGAARVEAALSATASPRPLLGETRAVVVIHRGRLVAERYMPGYGPDTPLVSWSMAKSVTQALVGVAVRRGLVDIDRPMGNPRWASGDPRAAVPWRSWINMVDGQDYHEIGVVDQTRSDAARMLFGVGRRDVAGYAAALPLVHPPGTHWNYNSAGVNLVSDALGRVIAPGAAPAERRARMSAMMSEELFAPIGMASAQPEFDGAGTFIGSAWVYATARDWARFGLLYLRDGVWDGRRILPEHWVDFARSKTPAADCDVYGAGFWITPAAGTGKPYKAVTPNIPRDLFLAEGHEGQVVVIVPSKDLVVVRLGHLDDLTGWDALGEWLDGIVGAFPNVAG